MNIQIFGMGKALIPKRLNGILKSGGSRFKALTSAVMACPAENLKVLCAASVELTK